MSEIIKCMHCDKYMETSECDRIEDDEIVTCSKCKDNLDIFCWDCELKPANSSVCIVFQNEQKEKYSTWQQFTKEEIFDD